MGFNPTYLNFFRCLDRSEPTKTRNVGIEQPGLKFAGDECFRRTASLWTIGGRPLGFSPDQVVKQNR